MKSTKHHFSLVFEACFPPMNSFASLLPSNVIHLGHRSKQTACVHHRHWDTQDILKTPDIPSAHRQNRITSQCIFGDIKRNDVFLTKFNGQNGRGNLSGVTFLALLLYCKALNLSLLTILPDKYKGQKLLSHALKYLYGSIAHDPPH